ncbi:uncharacterized protein LOC119724799 [Patiria miniata]|uniref:Uncharacterized protein n=1 Tax=Patiria miniata TaxID=46514 RepID=A0A913ZKU2_PATMI|nr:uncharacterized protein LOC119724799 [Patiria miniata]XP_038051945.1 uncharacterized protein LOC119724799 [Patiria miniata]
MNSPPPPYNGHQQVTQQPQPMVAIQPNPSASDTTGSRSYWKGLQITGYMQVVLGVISVLLGFLAIVFKSFMYPIGIPIWSGICFYIITGIFGIASGRKQAKGLVITYMVLCIMTALAGCGVCIAHGIGILIQGFVGCPDFQHHPYLSNHDPYDFIYRVGCSSSFSSRAAINGLISVLGCIEMIVAIVGASFTCCVLCHSTTPTQVVTYTSTVPQQTVVQYAATPQQQYVQQPQYGNAMYPVQQVVVAPPQYQPQAQGQVQNQPTPQGQAQAPPPEKLPPADF